jgi:site-specific DNA-methyltransferase (adenine-specific)
VPKKTTRPPKPLYRQKPPPPGRAVLPRRPDQTADQQVSPTTDDFLHATPLTPAPFELKDDGSVVAAVCDRRGEAEERRSQSAATSLPRLAFADPARQLWLYHGNCLELLDAIAAKHPEGRFDAIFADPPYFLSNGGISCHAGRMVKVDKGDWDKSRGAELNHEFNTEWLRRCQRVLKPNGTIWVSGTQHVIFSIGYAMQQLGFKILNDIAWEKPNPPPNLSCRYFTHSTETILWAAKNEKSKHVFNYQEMKQVTGKQMKTVWKMTAPGRDEKQFGKHPTQKPLALIERCLLASTKERDLILDPFLGGGTTAVAAVRLKRGCVGIEMDEAHANLAVKRIKGIMAEDLFSSQVLGGGVC